MALFRKLQAAGETDAVGGCIDCAYFRNSPEYLEEVIPGLKTMSSGHSSVRKDDGICSLHGLYLSADGHCDQFTLSEGPVSARS